MSTSSVTCPKCHVTNRIPADRLKDGPKCGKCKVALFTGRPINLSAANVAAVLNHNDIPVLVDCWADWCGPCKQFAPTFEQAARELEPGVRLAKLDTERNQQIAGRWHIRSIPTLILFRKGKEVGRLAGAVPLQQLKKWLAEQGV